MGGDSTTSHSSGSSDSIHSQAVGPDIMYVGGVVDFKIDANTSEWYFLEVNPIGKFSFVSEVGDYEIEK